MIPQPILYLCRCRLCGWVGPDKEVPEYRAGWAKMMPECPKCHQRRDYSKPEMIGKRKYHPSCMTYFAVHETCGTGHDESQPCPEKCPEPMCYRPKDRCLAHMPVEQKLHLVLAALRKKAV